MNLLSACLAEEERDAGLRVHAVAPGVVDTAMQETVRACSVEQFPQVERFRAMKRDKAFSSTEWVAQHMLDLAFGPEGAQQPVNVRFPPMPAA